MLYSVLMSVYCKEKPEFLRASMESIFTQTKQTNNFVLVCDGVLTEDLNAVISEMETKHNGILDVVRLDHNMGLGKALNIGMEHCKNEIVARMDSDDISLPFRCEKQIEQFEKLESLDILSGTIEEFTEDPDDITGRRELPLNYDQICSFSKKRNPFNHPAVMFRKSSVQLAGGYNEKYHLFEDYYLWVRMLKRGCIGSNLSDTILKMRSSPDQIMRRGGMQYAKDLLRFHYWMMKSGWSTPLDFLSGAVPHAAVCVLPNRIRTAIYSQLR